MKFWVFLLLFFSCSHTDTINLRHHSFGQKPAKIIWIQFPGFSEEHLAMLRFGMSEASTKTAFEGMECVGKIWNYNLFKLRPTFASGFRAQMLGTPNVKNTCADLQQNSIWSLLKRLGYVTGVLESNVKKLDSISELAACDGNQNQMTIWKMGVNSKGPFFHYQEKSDYSKGKTYFDKSCQKGSCYSNLTDNVKSLDNFFQKEYSRSLFIIREFGYVDALKRGDIFGANEVLLEVEKTLAYFLEKYKDEKEVLVLISSSLALKINFPKQGDQWKQFVKKGKGIEIKGESLISSVFASGASSENFCGVYDEYEVLYRLFWMTDTRKIKQLFMDLF